MRLTDNENTVLAGFNSAKYSFFDDGLKVDSNTWSTIFIEEMAEVLEKTTKSARGVFSSLVKKGIFTTAHAEADGDSPAQEVVYLTEAGIDAISELRFEDEALDFEVELEEAPLPPVIEKAAKERKAKKVATPKSTSARFSHANCDHETSGREGKIARAKCRREQALLESAAEKVAK